MHKRTLGLAAIAGLLTGLVVAATMAAVDWHINPGGIFRNDFGTDWAVVAETALSWFWPVALAAFLAATLVLYAFAWLKSRSSYNDDA